MTSIKELAASWGKDVSGVRRWLAKEGLLSLGVQMVHPESNFQHTWCFTPKAVAEIDRIRRKRGFIDAPVRIL